MNEVLTTLGVSIGTGLLRSVAGWFENAMKDGEISNYEFGQLGATVLRTVVLGLGLHFGLGLDSLAAAGGALIADVVMVKLDKLRKGNK